MSRLERGNQRVETELVLTEGKRFSPETKQALEEAKLIVRHLKGDPIKVLRERFPIAPLEKEDGFDGQNVDFENESSPPTEVAFLPQWFLPNSNRSTCSQQRKMLPEFESKVSLRFPGTKIAFSGARDFVEAGCLFWKEPGKKLLFGENFTRTGTSVGGNKGVIVGNYEKGIKMKAWDEDGCYHCVGLFILLVPA